MVALSLTKLNFNFYVLSTLFLFLGSSLSGLDISLEQEFSRIPLGFEKRVDFLAFGLKAQVDEYSSNVELYDWKDTEGTGIDGDLVYGNTFFPWGELGLVYGCELSFHGDIPDVSGQVYFRLQDFYVLQGLGRIVWKGTWELGLGGFKPGGMNLSHLTGNIRFPNFESHWIWIHYLANEFIIGAGYGGGRTSLGGILNSSEIQLDSFLGYAGYGPVKLFAAAALGKGEANLDPFYRWILNLEGLKVNLDLQAASFGLSLDSKTEILGFTLGGQLLLGTLFIPSQLVKMVLTRSEWDWESWTFISTDTEETFNLDFWQPTYGFVNLWISQSWDTLQVTLGRRIFWTPGMDLNVKSTGSTSEESNSEENPWEKLIKISKSPWPKDWWWTGIYLQVRVLL